LNQTPRQKTISPTQRLVFIHRSVAPRPANLLTLLLFGWLGLPLYPPIILFIVFILENEWNEWERERACFSCSGVFPVSGFGCLAIGDQFADEVADDID
jgi:hypothetical protein